jgi:Delta7-sterol 5-desaturase
MINPLTSIALMTLIVAVRYLAVSGGFAWLTARLRPKLYAGQTVQIRREMYWSLVSAGIYGAPAGLAAWAWSDLGLTRIYTDTTNHPWWMIPVSVLTYLLIHDSWFYWTHRWMHERPRIFRTVHAVHHESRPPTAWAAMSFHPYEALTGAFVIPLLVFIIPIHIIGLGIVLTIMTLCAVTNHMGWEIMPARFVKGVLGRWLITASHHHRHHTEYRGNYGLYFRHWDRVCGTDKGLGQFRDPDRSGGRYAAGNA